MKKKTRTRRKDTSRKPIRTADPISDYVENVKAGIIITCRWVKLACARHDRDLKRRDLRFDLFCCAECDDKIFTIKNPCRHSALYAIGFFRDVLRLNGGQFEGKPFVLEPWQVFIVGSLFGWKLKDGRRRFNTAYVESAKGSGKALALDTPIPTPSGWTTMGELQVGSMVFDDTGLPCRVTAATAVMENRQCYSLTFGDGETIVADAGHLWRVATLRNGKKPGPRADRDRRCGYFLRTTEEISKSWRMKQSASIHPQAKYNHRVDLAGALQLPTANLSVAPYTLGAWLGDGDSDCARITIGDQDVALVTQLRADGMAVGERKGYGYRTAGRYLLGSIHDHDQVCRRGHPIELNRTGTHCLACNREVEHAHRHNLPIPAYTVSSLQEKLRGMGLLNNKHIPAQYLRASKEQRLDLLQGLLDTDGSVTISGAVEFSSKWRRLAEDVAELIRSLGFKAKIADNAAVLNGKIIGRRYRLLFHPTFDIPVFKLPRKLQRQKSSPKTHALSKGRMIVNVAEVPSVPVRCISVDSPTRMFLCGKTMIPTHNSPLLGGLGHYGLVADNEMRAEIYAAAVKKDQAMILFRDAVAMRDQSPHLAARLQKSGVGEKCWNLADHSTGSWFRPISSEEDSQSGPRPHFALVDEVHEHKSSVVIDMLSAGFKWRRNPLMAMITNSGFDRETVCWRWHEYVTKILKRTAGTNNDRVFGFICCLDPCEKHWNEGQEQPVDNCRECDDWATEGPHWKKPNPNLGVSIDLEYLRNQVRKGIDMPAEQNTVRRLNFGYWTNQATRWLSMQAWDSCSAPIDYDKLRGRSCIVGLDLANKIDIAALVLIFPPENLVLREPIEFDGMLNDLEKTALEYVKNSNGGATLDHFLEDHEPIGPQLWGSLKKFGLVYEDEGGRVRIDADRVPAKVSAAGSIDYAKVDIDQLSEDFIVLPYFFIPKDNITEAMRRDDVPYDVWVRNGLMEATEGNVIDYQAIKQKLIALNEIYPIRSSYESNVTTHLAGFDPWNATEFANDMRDKYSINMIEVRQGYQTMSEPTKEMARLVIAKKVRHGGNPVLRWMADNVVVRTDPAGNLKPDKEKSKKKIDGIVGLIIALSLAIRHANDEGGSVYETRGVLRL